jgi:hypothetical protein
MVAEEKRRIAASKVGTSGLKEITAAVPDTGKEVANTARQQRAIMLEALADERVHDEASFSMAIRARQQRAERDYRLDNAVAALDAKLTRREIEAGTEGDSGSSTPKTSNGGSATPIEAEGGKNGAKGTIANGASNGTTKALEGKPEENGTKTTHSDATEAPQSNDTPEKAAKQDSKALVTKGKSAVALFPSPSNGNGGANAGARRWVDDGREYPILTERAAAVARWVREAPPNAGSSPDGPRKRKKKPTKKLAAGSALAERTNASSESSAPVTAEDGKLAE